jgi:ABC-type multidrug transport system fused ATPase/permease subunit
MFRQIWRESTVGRATAVLTQSDKRKLALVSAIQIALGVFDLIGVVLVGILGSMAVSGGKTSQPGSLINTVFGFLNLDSSTFRFQVIVISALAIFFLAGRTLFSIYFTRKIIFFLSRRGAFVSANLISRLLSESILKIQKRTTQETLFAVTTGVEVITLNILATAVTLVADIALLIIMLLGLFFIEPLVSIVTISIFGLIGIILYMIVHKKAKQLGSKNSELRIKSNEKIVEVFSSYRESVVRNRRDYYSREIGKMRYSLADVLAESIFMPYIGKYVIETAVVLSAVIMGIVHFSMGDSTQAISTLAIFLASGSRIAPAVLRLQQGAVIIRANSGAAVVTLDLISELQGRNATELVSDIVNTDHLGFKPDIEISKISFTYPGKQTPAISDVELKIKDGEFIAIVGSSGSGKTTLVDLLLGVLEPSDGSILVSGENPVGAITKWPGAISYVAQDVTIGNGTIRENITLGYPSSAVSDLLVDETLELSHLKEFVEKLEKGIHTEVGERGALLSGGQRQRLGIARALVTRPKLLVLDEATSSLDGATEFDISESLNLLRGSTTVIMIAHRLSTVRKADLVVYLHKGSVAARGTFEEVRIAVPDFDKQAKLMGI